MLLQKHYDKLKFVINHGSDEQLRDIGLDQKTISRLRQDISYIKEMKLSTALKLYHFYFDYWATIVGIDIGTSEFLSASDLSMKKIYTDQSKEVSRIITKYKNRLKDSNMDAGKIKRKFLKGYSFKNKVGPSKPKAQMKKKGKGKSHKTSKTKKGADKG